MKRKALALIKKLGLKLLKWRSYRSDMGCQCYEIEIEHKGKFESFYDSYFPGELYGAKMVDGKVVGGVSQKDLMYKEILNFLRSFE